MRFIIAAAALVLTSPSMADEPVATSSEAPAKPAKAPKPKKICRDSEVSSYSRVGSGKTCHTAEEWAAIDAGGKDAKSGGRAVRSFGGDAH